MRIKYLLSGRIFSDTYQLRRLIDSWPDEYNFPEIVQDIKSIKEEDIEVGTLDNRYYTETELDAGQLDNRYYTENELDAGQLDKRY